MSRSITSTAVIRDQLPRPAISPPLSPQQFRLAVSFRKSRWKSFKDAIRTGTGYGSKPPEWSGSTLDFSEHQNNEGADDDAVLDNDDLAWISGKDGGDALALVLVERSHSATSQASQNPTASQENLPNHNVDQTNHPRAEIAHDYRLKGYEDSLHGMHTRVTTPFTWLWYRTIPWLRRAFLRYCYPEFNDRQVESLYAERVYVSQKFLAFICSTWLVISWLIAITLLSKDHLLYDSIFFYGIAPALTVPLPVMIFYDVPKRFPLFYQPFLVAAVWCWSAYTIIFIQLCNYYGGGQPVFTCQGRDMMNLFYYMIALPVIALFGMGQERIYATIAPLIMIITPTVLFYERKNVWVRFALEHLFLQALFLYIHWRREILERNVFYVNKKVKDTLIALHQTRLHQSRVEAARARSTSYIFHEVRQPLSAAFLAYQNLAASTSIKPEQWFEWDTLRIKLMSMSKLLNDVLDQKRMDAGKFEIVSRPFSFHSIVRQTIFGSQIAADMKNQQLIVNLDKNIDRVARIAICSAQGKSGDEIQRLLNESPDEDGILVGDETRLSQVLNNLISNSSKFTPVNGKIRVNTRLISPRSPRTGSSAGSAAGSFSPPRLRPRTSSQPLLTLPESHMPVPLPSPSLGGGSGRSSTNRWEDDPDRLVVRIEVTDTGCGISPSDVKERRLFSPYAQAGVGRFQGGSGTGLGLSLVRRIVKLMGGRMGVESVPAAGTTFWVELPLRVASSPTLPLEHAEPMLAVPSIAPVSEQTVTPGSDATTATPAIMTMPPFVSSPMSSYTSAQAQPSGSGSGKPPTVHSDMSDSAQLSTRSNTGDTAPTTARTHSTSNQSSAGNGLSVLVVDDDPVLRGLLQRLLKRLGCDVEGAENGLVALQKLGIAAPGQERVSPSTRNDSNVKAEPLAGTLITHTGPEPARTYDVVFLDHQMPKMTGPKVASALRKAGRHDFLVGLSGDSNVLDQETFREAGVDDFLSKPVLESQVKKVLQAALARRTGTEHPPNQDHQPP